MLDCGRNVSATLHTVSELIWYTADYKVSCLFVCLFVCLFRKQII